MNRNILWLLTRQQNGFLRSAKICLPLMEAVSIQRISGCEQSITQIRAQFTSNSFLSNGRTLDPSCQGSPGGDRPRVFFTTEEPVQGALQFLDVRLLQNDGFCLVCGKASLQPLLRGNIAHPKHIKPGLGNPTLIHNALNSSCSHQVSNFASSEVLSRIKGEVTTLQQLSQCSGRKLEELRVRQKKTVKLKKVVVPYYPSVSNN